MAMDNRKTPMISIGFWSDSEGDSATQVKRLPESILQSVPVKQDEVIMSHNNLLSQNIYLTLTPVLNHLNQECPINKFKYKKICDLTVLPKNASTNHPLNLSMYHVFSDELKGMDHFFLIDETQRDVAYARFVYNEQSPHVDPVYTNLSFIALDAIESKMRGNYSLGPILVQAVFEHSLNAGCEGRIILYSANKTGEVYFKYGFTPLKEETFDRLYYNGEKEVDGGIMFLTNSAIDAWKEKSKTHSLLTNPSTHEKQFQ